MTTHLYLIRHGESTWNQAGRVQGWGDPVLSRRGLAQAAALAHRFRRDPPHRIYVSPLRRARQTAQPVAEITGLPVQPVADLREVGLGRWEGRPVAQLRRRHPALYHAWLHTPSRAQIPEGEGIPVFRRRVLGAFRGILEEADHGAMVALVTHGGVIRVILAHVLGIPFDPLMRGISLGNTSVTRITRTRGRLAITVLNDTAHLMPGAR